MSFPMVENSNKNWKYDKWGYMKKSTNQKMWKSIFINIYQKQLWDPPMKNI